MHCVRIKHRDAAREVQNSSRALRRDTVLAGWSGAPVERVVLSSIAKSSFVKESHSAVVAESMEESRAPFLRAAPTLISVLSSTINSNILTVARRR